MNQEEIFVESSNQGRLCIRVISSVATSSPPTARRSEEMESDRRCSLSKYRPGTGGSAGLGMGLGLAESEERVFPPHRAGRKVRHTRFLTLHRRRKRKPPNRCLFQNQALLDDLYNGPTEGLLLKTHLWEFNTFALDSACGGRPVLLLCVFLMHKYGLLETFRIEPVAVWKCFSMIEEGYHASNPYHNAVHAADVTQAMHCFLSEEKISSHLSPLERFAALIAAVCHDLDHPGVNQPFLIATDNHLAALYKNLSVLENHHWRCALGCMYESGILDTFTTDDIGYVQDIIQSLILATDITQQGSFLLSFKEYLDSETMDTKDRECRIFSLQIALKCADICNPCRPWDISSRWAEQVCEEFFRQGDYERQLNIPITPLCDRYTTTVAKIQIGFIKFVVTPLFESWNQWLQTSLSTGMMSRMKHNLSRWEAKEVANSNKSPADSSVVSDSSSYPLLPQLFSSYKSIQDIGKEDECLSSRSSSSESQHSTLGSLESVSQSLLLGRRHSLPVNVPNLLPRTVLRRESLPGAGRQGVTLETVVVGDFARSSLSTAAPSALNSYSSSDVLLPDPSIVTMGEVVCHPSHQRRRLSLPPAFIHKPYVPSLSPSKEEAQERSRRKERKPKAVNVSSSSGGEGSSSTQDSNQGCSEGSCGSSEGSQGHSRSPCQADKPASILKESNCTSLSMAGPSYEGRSTQEDRSKQEGILRSSGQSSLEYHASCPESRTSRSRASALGASDTSQGVLTRQESFEFELGKEGTNEKDASSSAEDKENLAPRDARTGERSPVFWRSRAWNSLSQDEEGVHDPRLLKQGPPYKTVHYQGRRGSAPLLKLDDSLPPSSKGADKPVLFRTQRRGSAPSYYMHQDHKTLYGGGRGFAYSGGVWQPPLKRMRGFLPQSLNRTNSFSLLENYIATRAGYDSEGNSDPNDNYPLFCPPFLPDNFAGRDQVLRLALGDVVSMEKVGEVSLDPQAVRRGSRGGTDCSSGRTGNRGLSGSLVGGGGFPHLAACHSYGQDSLKELRRGSAGLELISGLWRNQLESSFSIRSQPPSFDDYEQVSSGTSPVVGFQQQFFAFPCHRRGSLPVDLCPGDFLASGSASDSS